MKKLTIEEKAKAYDEAIKRAKEWFNQEEPDSYTCIVESIFPELKENSGETIRKELIRAFKSLNTIKVWNGIERTDILAWLEKQGETFTKKDVDDAYLKGIFDAKQKLEKQGEQSTIDKVEPKFHEGDWVVNNEHPNCGNSLMRIVKVGLTDYLCLYYNGQTTYCREFIDKSYHLWTIQDAKNGDVLVCPKYAGDIIPNIFIFKNIERKDNDVFCHCSFLEKFRTEGYVANADPINTDFYPATKEQRDQLEKAIADAGYTFDFEKKELRKIEQKPVCNNTLKESVIGILEDFIQEWDLNEINRPSTPNIYAEQICKLIEQKSAEWSEEDEQWWKIIAQMGLTEATLDWIRTLINRATLQPKQEWSEEDANRMDNLCNFLEEYGNSIMYGHLTLQDMISWLKSLRPHKQWKPSDGQMDSITCTVRQMKDSACYDSELVSLYQDLKRLK